MRGGKTTVIGSASQPVSSRLLYTAIRGEPLNSRFYGWVGVHSFPGGPGQEKASHLTPKVSERRV